MELPGRQLNKMTRQFRFAGGVFALQLLQDNPGSNFVIDARNGFEDDKRDAESGFQYLLPEMSETSCRYICFIMNQVNDIEAEMDMWTLEFGKYFGVTRAETFEQAIYSLQHYIFTDVKYVIKEGKILIRSFQ